MCLSFEVRDGDLVEKEEHVYDLRTVDIYGR